MRKAMRKGFTLLEVLVTLILLGILVAIVFPVVTQQIDDAEPTKAANDFANIRTGIELFHLNVRPTFPGDIEDLAVQIDATNDSTLGSATNDYDDPKDVNRWKGPYIDASVTSEDPTASVLFTGFSGEIINDLKLFDSDQGTGGTSEDFTTDPATTITADFLALQIDNLDEEEFEAINDLIDGTDATSEADGTTSQTNGKFRYLDPDGSGKTAFYLAVPYTN